MNKKIIISTTLSGAINICIFFLFPFCNSVLVYLTCVLLILCCNSQVLLLYFSKNKDSFQNRIIHIDVILFSLVITRLLSCKEIISNLLESIINILVFIGSVVVYHFYTKKINNLSDKKLDIVFAVCGLLFGIGLGIFLLCLK